MDERNWTPGKILSSERDDNGTDVLVLGDFETRIKCYEIALRTGILTRTEIRELENLPEPEGGYS